MCFGFCSLLSAVTLHLGRKNVNQFLLSFLLYNFCLFFLYTHQRILSWVTKDDYRLCDDLRYNLIGIIDTTRPTWCSFFVSSFLSLFIRIRMWIMGVLLLLTTFFVFGIPSLSFYLKWFGNINKKEKNNNNIRKINFEMG